jgi:hypothetical protein
MSIADDEGGSMLDSIPGHWWAIFAAAVTGFVGFRISAAQDKVRVEILRGEVDAVKNRLAQLEGGSARVAETLARMDERLEGVGRTLSRIEGDLKSKADRT